MATRKAPQQPPSLPVNFETAVEPERAMNPRRAAAPKKPPPAKDEQLTLTISAGSKRVTVSIRDEGGDDAEEPRVAQWRIDERGKIVRGDVAYKILGFGQDYKSRDIPWSVVHPDDVRRVRLEWERVNKLKKSDFQFRYRVKRADGEWIEVLHKGMLVECDGEFCGYKGTIEVVK